MSPLRIFLGAAVISATTLTTFAQGTAFTYQGRLNDGASVANGIYDLRFTIYDLVSGGAQQGNALTNAATAISNGLFTVTLDFGDQFPGAGRWLEIGVRTNGIGAFATLSPRQQLTSTPYALRAANATTANSAGSVAAANITGTIPLAKLPTAVVTNGASGVNITGTFSGNAGGLSNLNSAKLTGPVSVSFGDPVNIGHAYNGQAVGVAVSGNYAYLANYDDGLRVYDISNPANPLNVGHTNSDGVAQGVAVSGNYAYLANNSDGLRVYDISNPANPVNIGHTNNGGAAYGVAVAGNYACLANGNDGLRVYDISNPANPLNIGRTNNVGFAQGVAVSGNYAYLANGNDGLRVYDISNPANPLNIGHTNSGGFAQGVAVSGNYAYLANGNDGLRVYNISNPANPMNIGHTNNGGIANGVAVSGNYAYLANDDDGLRVYDISNPANPLNIGHTYNGGNAIGVAVSGNYAYLADLGDGLRVYALGVVNAGSFRGDGSELTGLNASQLTSGTVPDAQLSANVSLLGSSIQSAEITDGTISNVDISATAAIADTKLATISTAGKVADTALSANVPLLSGGKLNDSVLSANVALRSGGNTFSSDQVINGVLFNYGGQIVRPVMPGYAATTEWDGTNDNSGFRAIVGAAGYGLTPTTNHMFVGTYSPHPVGFYVNGVQRMTIDTTGNVGIGTASPGSKLEVNGDARIAGGNLYFDNAKWILAKSTNGTYENFLWPRWVDDVTYLNYGTNGFAIRNNSSVTTMFMQNNGNVGIGTTSPGFLLEVNGSAGKPGGGSWSVASDERLKKNIRPLAGALDKLLALHGVNFEYIDPAKIHELSGERMGLLAQEVEEVFPDWVETGKDGYKRVTVRGMEALVPEALRELRDEQNAKMAEIEKEKDAEIKTLKDRLEKLERLISEKNGGAK